MNGFLSSALRVGSLAVSIIVIGTLVAEAAPKRLSHAQQKCMESALEEYNRNVEDCEKRGLEHGYSSAEQAQCIALFTAALHRELQACGVASIVIHKAGLTGPKTLPLFGGDDTDDGDHASTNTPGNTSTGDSGGSENQGSGDGGTRDLGGTFDSSIGSALLSQGNNGAIIQ